MKDTENRPPSRKRRKWGSVIVRRDADGNPTSFQARYVNPLDPPKKVGRNFGLEYETEAYRWLDEERYLVTLHNKGIRQWVHPSQRGANTMPTFREYSKDYFDKYRKPDGSKLSGRSNRCNEIVLRRLNEAFGDTPLDRITRQMVDEWYVNARDELTAWTFEQAARTLKRVMLAAANEQADGTPPLIPASPCRYRVVKPQSKRRDQPPVTADEINRLAELFPAYQRLALWLSLLAGGLRIGEVCALQLRDIDLENLQLHVRHSVNRGPDDRGKYQLCEPKTKSSKGSCPSRNHSPRSSRPISAGSARTASPTPCCFTRLCWTIGCSRPRPSNGHSAWPAKRSDAPTSPSTRCAPRAPPCSSSRAGPCARRWTTSNTSLTVAVDSYQRVVREHHRDTVELLAYRYMPSNDPTVIRTVIDQKERQIDKLRDEVERLRKILLERDTGIPTDPDTVLPKNQNR